jgi:hypothetical protein
MNKSKSTARNGKTKKAKVKSLKVRTKVRAGRITGNRCEALQRRT